MNAEPVATSDHPPGLIRRCLDGLYLGAGILAGFFLIVIFVLMMAMSVGREFGLNIPSGDDFASWCMAAMAFLGLAHTFRSGELIRVGLLIDRLKGRSKRAAEFFALTMGVGFSSYFAYHAIQLTLMSYQINDMSQGVIAVPLWIPQLGFTSGLTILAIAMIDELIHALRGGEPRYEKPPPQTAEEAVQRAIESAV